MSTEPMNRPALWKIAVAIVCVLVTAGGLVFAAYRTFARPDLDAYAAQVAEDDRRWAQAVLDGGYFLHFRHTEREKWDTTLAFDALVLARGIDAEGTVYERATCLTERGRIEAQVIGEVFEHLGVEVSQVLSSPSCRARQTARAAFGTEGRVVNALLHRSAIPESQHPDFDEALLEAVANVEPGAGANVVLSGHGATLSRVGAETLDASAVPMIDEREEGSFVVLELTGGRLVARHIFRSFGAFSTRVLELPATSTP